MKIYWFKAQAPRRVLALAKHLKIHAEFIQLDLMGGELQKPKITNLNPNMKAPILVDGDFVLWESSAIMAYLCIKTESNMWPAHNPQEQVEVLKWLSWNDSHWSKAVDTHYFEHIVKSEFGMGPPNRDAMQAQVPNFMKFAKVLDAHLQNKTYVACDRLTIADFQLASMVSYWKESEMPMNDFPNIIQWIDRLMKIPAWANPWPTSK